MSEETKTLNIYQRINEVRREVEYIKKDAKVQGYKAVTHDAVTSAIRASLVKHGVLIVPKLINSEFKETGSITSSGTNWMMYRGWYNVEVVNCDEPSDKVEVPTEAHALDTGDKAPGKATSYATKYVMLKLFSIETGENEEGRQEMKPKGKISGDNIDMPKVKKAVNYFKAQIDEDDPDNASDNIKKAWDRLTNDERMEVQQWLGDKAPDTNRMYKTILKDHLNVGKDVPEE